MPSVTPMYKCQICGRRPVAVEDSRFFWFVMLGDRVCKSCFDWANAILKVVK